MVARLIGFSSILSLCLWTAGCARTARVSLMERTGGNAALFGQFRAYDGHTGRPISFADVAAQCAQADVVLFGEQHSDAVCNQIEAQLLCALAAERRPVALAMEFFEADTQASLDAYLRDRIDEAAYRMQTRRSRAYVLSHRPLVELCRAARIPVVAANAPRRLVRAYRESGLDYEAFRAGVDPADRRWLPIESKYLTGAYKQRFFEIMRRHGPGAPSEPGPEKYPESQPASAPATTSATAPVATTAPASMPARKHPSGTVTRPTSAPGMPPVARMPKQSSVERFFRAQLLWDEAMAEALADFRERYAAHRVMLIVGVFHVAHDGGTAAKLRARRPADRVVTVVYSGTTDGSFAFDDDDRDAGDVVIYGIAPPPKEKHRPAMPPAKPVETQPTTTAPGTADPT